MKIFDDNGSWLNHYKVTYKYLLTKPYNSLKEIKTLHYWRKQTESLAQKVIT